MKKHQQQRILQVFCTALFVILLTVGAGVQNSAAVAEETSVLKGMVSDVEDRAVEGAMVYVYTSPEVRRAAEFISAPTNKDGVYSLVMPQGQYWVVARLKKAEDFGPLMPGDKHSGDPEELELESDEAEMNFVVADLKEAIRMKRETMERPFKITGRIIDEDGKPVTDVYVFANRSEDMARIPDYVSSWVSEKGVYTLYVPSGEYHLGGASRFPPGDAYTLSKQLLVKIDKTDVDIVVKRVVKK